jgi:MFS superfamily sulfate permease-like transporter
VLQALLRGFITAVGLVIFASQLIPVLGLDHLVNKSHPPTSFVEKIAFVVGHARDAHRLTVAVSLVALAVLILAKLFKARLAQRKGFTFLSYVPEYGF